MKLKVYLDTSVLSACFDDRAPDRKRLTLDFFENIARFEVASSDLLKAEIMQTRHPEKREKLLELMRAIQLFPLSGEMDLLAREYVKAQIFTPLMFNDALHVAAAVHSGQNVLISWNFKHLVNRQRRAKIADLNCSLGLPEIEILAPAEL